MKQHCYNAALYLRLSRDDDGVGDSGSIKTQQMMLERYCLEQQLQVYDVYIDDGFSGLNFNRPAFQRLLLDIKNGLVNLVITKDLSRLGRDYIQTGFYTELFFPQHSVRYIALNDGVDTLHDNNDIAPFKNILNDMYARDLSRKVKSAKHTRAVQGAFIGSHPPYGYQQRENNCNVLEVNEETAAVVQRIFQLSLGGTGAITIAKRLREEKVLTPAAYKVGQGDNRFAHLYRGQPDERKYRWAYTTVQRILRDKVYLGHMVGHKSQVKHYKTKQRTAVPHDEQILVENTHPPLIREADFSKIQQLTSARHSPQRDRDANVFRALLYCDECGHRMSMATKTYGSREILYYRCMHHYHFPEECAGTHYLRFDHLYQIVLTDFQRIAELLTCRMDSLIQSIKQPDDKQQNAVLARRSKLEDRNHTIGSIIKQLYEDFVAGRTTIQNYNRLISEYQQEQEEIESKLAALKENQSDQKDVAASYQRLREVVERHLAIQELNVPMLHELIDHIDVGQREKADHQWMQDIRIAYRFAGEIPEVWAKKVANTPWTTPPASTL